LRLQTEGFRDILYWGFVWKFVDRRQVYLKWDTISQAFHKELNTFNVACVTKSP
jgi:hypothetical protein